MSAREVLPWAPLLMGRVSRRRWRGLVGRLAAMARKAHAAARKPGGRGRRNAAGTRKPKAREVQSSRGLASLGELRLRHGASLALLRVWHGNDRANRLALRRPLDALVRLIRHPGSFLPWLGRKALSLALRFHVWYLGFVVLLCGLYTFMNPAVTGIMVYRTFVSRHEVAPTVFIPRTSIPKSLQRAFIRLEDNYFYDHKGIHLGALREAMERNLRLGEMVFGGSTISQQTARTIFLHPDRTLVRKWLELLTVFPMEWILGKNRILELYLNYIEFGKGAFGLGRGAIYQYGRSFYKLSAEERIRLAVIITSPIRFNVRNYYKQPGMAARYRALMN